MNDTPPSDGEVIEAVLAGNPERFVELVRRYEGALLRLARNRLGDEAAAEDAVQESFLCAFRSLPTYDSTYSFRTWLWTIVLNQCRRQWQREARRQQRLPESGGGTAELVRQQADPGAQPPLERLVRSERDKRLKHLLERLPEAQADALRLRFFGDLKFQEIADVMNCSLSTAKNRVRWGLAALSQLARSTAASLLDET